MTTGQKEEPFMTEIGAGQFKARCLALLDEVASTGKEVVVTKRGRPVARVVPLRADGENNLVGSVDYDSEEDLLDPVAMDWKATGAEDQ